MRLFLSWMIAALLTGAAFAQEIAFREFYSGAGLGGVVSLEITAGDDGSLSASVRLRGSEPRTLLGSIDADGAVRLAEDQGNARFEGTRDAQSKSLVGRVEVDGQSGDLKLPLRAEWEFLDWRLGEKVTTELAWPRVFSAGAPVQQLNEEFRYGALELAESFFAEMREMVDTQTFDRPGPWASASADVAINYAGDTFISALIEQFEDTGGAHPNGFFTSMNYEIKAGEASPLALGDLFADPITGNQAVGTRCLDELKKAGAAWILDGTVASLDEETLHAWTLGPEGLTVHFEPYAVGPYSQGAFRVAIPLAELPTPKPGSVLARLRG